MFQNQHGSIVESLVRAGIPRQLAAELARVLSNPLQELKSGPIKQDTTPRNMRQVTPEDRLTLPNLDFRNADPDFREKATEPGEVRAVPVQADAVQERQAPQQNIAVFAVTAGDYLSVVPAGKSARVSLKLQGQNDGVPVVQAGNKSLVSKTVRAECNNVNGMQFFVDKNAQEMVWKLVFDQRAATGIDVVTDVTLEDKGLVVKKRRIYPTFFEDEFESHVIDVEECP